MSDEQTAASQQNWDSAAAGWSSQADFLARSSLPVQEWLIEHLDPKPGETFLELGAGPGDLGFAIARRLGPDGKLISTDFAPRMVDTATRRAAAMGLSNVEFRTLDAQRNDLRDASVDAVVHKYGPMLLPDAASAASHNRRILRPGGRFATAVWGNADTNPWILLMGLPVIEHGHMEGGGDPFGPGGMFSFAEPAQLTALLEDAGFADVIVEAVDQPYTFGSFEALWVLPSEIAGPIAATIKALAADQVAEVQASMQKHAEPYRDGDGYQIPAQALCAFGRA